MTITQLETFLKIAETRSFTAAAGLLGYAQSTVTMQVKQLEEELGCLLFVLKGICAAAACTALSLLGASCGSSLAASV